MHVRCSACQRVERHCVAVCSLRHEQLSCWTAQGALVLFALLDRCVSWVFLPGVVEAGRLASMKLHRNGQGLITMITMVLLHMCSSRPYTVGYVSYTLSSNPHTQRQRHLAAEGAHSFVTTGGSHQATTHCLHRDAKCPDKFFSCAVDLLKLLPTWLHETPGVQHHSTTCKQCRLCYCA